MQNGKIIPVLGYDFPKSMLQKNEISKTTIQKIICQKMLSMTTIFLIFLNHFF
jgi:hypothetical protein